MPLPGKRKNEDHDKFIGRCMADPVMRREFPKADQRRAVCEKQWEKPAKGNEQESETMTTATKPERLRLSITESMHDARVDWDNRVIHDYAIVTRGEVTGWNVWCDEVALEQVLRAAESRSRGVKSRFTHPGLCSDGLGSYLGLTKNCHLDGDIVRGDLHISASADRSPDGKLGTYILSLAEEQPDMFGASIVIARDKAAEAEFAAENEDESGAFVSPDPRNQKNLQHVRLSKLSAIDIVDSPAANPGGFLSDGQELAAMGDRACRYLFGIDDETPPADVFGGLEPRRVRDFVREFLSRNELILEAVEAEEPEMAKQKTEEAPKGGLAKLREAFPNDLAFAVDAFERDLTVIEAKVEYCDTLLARMAAAEAKAAELLAERDTEIAELKEKMKTIDEQLLAGADSVKHVDEPQVSLSEKKAALIAEAKRLAAENGTKYADEYSKLLGTHPEIDGQ